ncbi:uncharacterized protein EI90DRAFT_3038588 [Cantharellus anzutake]|uniref:uncharacterized protein n=1 Tax=Cantharellus anzutake TaxID=1750568 RepID=UPI001904F960|nr:uncharacterized protein EI90DRAFT_3038588 [Cantharellus anzutake]KAF8339956.1 hypothetical protein EI90DRAFT_3038588 [Cantharellus anzutake]
MARESKTSTENTSRKISSSNAGSHTPRSKLSRSSNSEHLQVGRSNAESTYSYNNHINSDRDKVIPQPLSQASKPVNNILIRVRLHPSILYTVRGFKRSYDRHMIGDARGTGSGRPGELLRDRGMVEGVRRHRARILEMESHLGTRIESGEGQHHVPQGSGFFPQTCVALLHMTHRILEDRLKF